MKYIISVFIFQTLLFTSIAQRSEFCQCNNLSLPLSEQCNDPSIEVSTKVLEDSLHITIKNKSSDTIYIFKSYFDRDIALSHYLYRYNRSSKNVNISFSPLVSYLFPTYSDNIIFQDRILQEYQVVFDFYVLNPRSEITINLKILNLQSKKRFIKDFDVKKLNKYQKLKKLSYVEMNTMPSYYVTIAYYKDISLLCNKSAFYFNELQFNNSSKQFTEVSSPVIF